MTSTITHTKAPMSNAVPTRTPTTPCVISASLSIQGGVRVTDRSALHIFGEVLGPVQCDGHVSVEAGGHVHGPISARSLTVAGSVTAIAPSSSETGSETNATLRVLGRFHLKPTGRVTASVISYGSLQTERGGRMSGALEPSDEASDDGPDETDATYLAVSVAAPAHAPAPIAPSPCLAEAPVSVPAVVWAPQPPVAPVESFTPVAAPPAATPAHAVVAHEALPVGEVVDEPRDEPADEEPIPPFPVLSGNSKFGTEGLDSPSGVAMAPQAALPPIPVVEEKMPISSPLENIPIRKPTPLGSLGYAAPLPVLSRQVSSAVGQVPAAPRAADPREFGGPPIPVGSADVDDLTALGAPFHDISDVEGPFGH